MRNSLPGLMKIERICRSLGESYVLFQTKPTNFLPPWNARRNPDLSALCWEQKNLFVFPTLDFSFGSSQRASWWDTRSACTCCRMHIQLSSSAVTHTANLSQESSACKPVFLTCNQDKLSLSSLQWDNSTINIPSLFSVWSPIKCVEINKSC